MRADPSARPQRMTLRSVGVVAAIFAVGIACGWMLGGRSAESGAPVGVISMTGVPSTPPRDLAAGATTDEPSVFISRLAEALAIRGRSQRERAFAAIADDLDAAQIRTALQQLDQTRLTMREQIRAALLARWAELEPEAAAAYALALPGVPQRGAALDAVVSGWVERDASAAARWVSALPENAAKTRVQVALIKAIAATDPQAALALMQEASGVPSRDARDLADLIFENWAKSDPRKAAQAAGELGIPLQTGASFTIAATWAGTDLDAALAWACSQANGLAESRFPAGVVNMNALTGVLQTWLNRNPDAARQWLEALPEGIEKSNLLQAAANMTSSSDPVHSLELAMLISEGTQQDNALVSATRSRVEVDPASALAWATEQPAGHVREMTLKVAAAEWLNTDRVSATKWLVSLPASTEKDAMLSDAVGVIVNGMQMGNLGLSPTIDQMTGEAYRDLAQLIVLIGDSSKKDAAYETLLPGWLRKNPNAARAWMAGSSIPQNIRDRLLRPPAGNQN